MHVDKNDVTGTTIATVWLHGSAHYHQMKGWFAPMLFAFFMLVVRQCLIMGSSFEKWANSSLACAYGFLFASVSPSKIGLMYQQLSCLPAELYTSRNLSRVSVARCLSDRWGNERGWTHQRENVRRGEDRKNRRSDVSACLQLCDTHAATGDHTTHCLNYLPPPGNTCAYKQRCRYNRNVVFFVVH